MGEVAEVRLCLLGFGRVVRRFCEIARDREGQLASEDHTRLVVTAVGTGSHGSWTDQTGRTPGEVLALFGSGGERFPGPERPGVEIIASSGATVLVEATPHVHGVSVAIAHLDAAFDAGMHVVTVNKDPVAWDYRRLRRRADNAGLAFRHEGVTMDGCPVYNLAEFCLPGDHVIGFRGVLNSTSNYVLDALAEGAPLAEAVAEAVEAGITETDPSHDLDGYDAAAKVAALANVLMDAGITPDAVARDSITDITPDAVARVISYGRRLRVIGEARLGEDGAVETKVALEPVRSQDPLYWVSGTSSCLVLQTELAGTIEIVERDGLLTQPAYALYADLLTILRTQRFIGP